MKLQSEISGARGFTACVATTYNIDIAWAERLLVRQLRTRGVRHLAIFADRARLSESLDAHVDLLRTAGHDYVLVGLDAEMSFHPKLLLLTGPERARLYIGSGNLTSHGYGRNREVFARFDVESADTSIPRAFEVVARYLSEVCAQALDPVPPFVRDVVDAAFANAVFAKPTLDEADEDVWGSPAALFDRLEAPTSPAARLRMLAPSFDAEGRMAIDLAGRLRAGAFEVITDLKTTNLTQSAADAIQAAGGKILVTEEDRPLHAKVIAAEGEGWRLAIVGSANLSSAAWRGYNAELVVVQRGDLVDGAFELLNDVPVRPFEPKDRARLETQLVSKPRVAGPTVLTARWESANAIVLSSAASHAGRLEAEVRNEAGSFRMPILADETEANVWRVSTTCAVEKGQPTLVRLVDTHGSAGGWVLVHDVESLVEQARLESRAETALRDLLGDHAFDGEGASRLLELMTRMWRERRQKDDEDGNDEPEPQESPIKLVWVRGEPPSELAPKPTTPIASSQYVLIPATLLRRLLFARDDLALSDDDASAEDAEVDAGTDDDGSGSNDDAMAEAARRSTAPPPVAQSFAREASEAFNAYVVDLARTDEVRPAGRLLSDLQLLAAAYHYIFRARAVPVMDFRRHMVELLRELVGFRNKPLVQALRALAARTKTEAWSRLPILQLLGLVSYNACLAHLELDPDLRDPSTVFHDGTPLWMRNVVRELPADVIDQILTSIARDARDARAGVLWLGERWPRATSDLSFASYLERLIVDARSLLAAERLLSPQVETRKTPFGDGARVIGLGRDGSLAVGWIEADEGPARAGRPARERVLLHDSAFLDPAPSPNEFRGQMHLIADASKAPLLDLDVARERARAAGASEARGVEVLASIS